MPCIAGLPYIRFEKEYCGNVHATYPSLSKAAAVCASMPNCPMVYDSYGAGTEFKICKDPADRRPSSKSVLYLKNGKYIKVRIPLPISLC